MLMQPQQAATVCELDLVLHTIGSSKRAQTLDPNQPPENSHEPLNLTLDLEYAHVSSLPSAPPTRAERWSTTRRRLNVKSRKGAAGDERLQHPEGCSSISLSRHHGKRFCLTVQNAHSSFDDDAVHDN